MAPFFNLLVVGVFCLLILQTRANDNNDRFRSLQQFLKSRENESGKAQRMHTLFSVECGPYFDWQTIGIMHSYRKSRQPGPITRLLSCTEEVLKTYPNMDLAPTFVVPSWTHHPRTLDWYPAINKPKGVLDWIEKSNDAHSVDWVVILDADMIIRAPVTPWEMKAEKGRPVAAYYGYLIGCDNILAQLHTKNPHLCDKVGGFLILHIDDIRKLAPLWLSKTEEVRADTAHYATNITGDIYGHGWISEMYGYSFGAAECELRHQVNNDIMLYPGYEPNEDPKLLHYGLGFSVGGWSFGKSEHSNDRIVNYCNRLFVQPPFPQDVTESEERKRKAAFLSIECVNTINEGLLIHHATHNCPEPAPSTYLTYLKENIRKAMRNDPQMGAGSLLRGTVDEPMLKLAQRFLQSTSSGLSEPVSVKKTVGDESDTAEVKRQEETHSESEENPGEKTSESENIAVEGEGEGAGEGEQENKEGENGAQENPDVDATAVQKVGGVQTDSGDNSSGQSTSSESDGNNVRREERSSLEDLPSNAPINASNWEPLQVEGRPKIVTLFSVECNSYFDWQTLGMMYSLKRSGHPGPVTRLLSCTAEDLKSYRGLDMAPTMVVPSWSRHPRTGEWYPAINKPVGVNHWLQNSPDAADVEWVVILDADMILRRPILPWELGAEKGRPVSSTYDYLIGCDNILGKLHMKDPSVCDKVGGFIVMHIDDLRKFAPLWLSKTEEVRADKEHYATNITGDVYGQGWISEMYGYSFGASDAGLRHKRLDTVMLYPGYMPMPKVDPRVLHYGLPMSVLEWKWNKGEWHTLDLANQCGHHFPDPPDPSLLPLGQDPEARRRDLISIECVAVLNRALKEYHRKLGCPGEAERDFGAMDLGLATPKIPYEESEKKVLVDQGEVVEGFKTLEHVGLVGEEKGLFVTLQTDKNEEMNAQEKFVEDKQDEVVEGAVEVETQPDDEEPKKQAETQPEVEETEVIAVDDAADGQRASDRKLVDNTAGEKTETLRNEKKSVANMVSNSESNALDSLLPDNPRWWILLPWALLSFVIVYVLVSRKGFRFLGRSSERSRRRSSSVWGKAVKSSWFPRGSLPMAINEDSHKDIDA